MVKYIFLYQYYVIIISFIGKHNVFTDGSFLCIHYTYFPFSEGFPPLGLGKVPLTERRFSKINGSVR